MENKDQPAFPIEYDLIVEGQQTRDVMPGVSKREYFAGLAMAALISHPNSVSNEDMIAGAAISYADELLKKLSNGNG